VERAARARPGGGIGGNFGQTTDGRTVLGSVTSPGISPFAITVGALRTQGTADPSDDVVAPWSSRGPTMVDHIVKPDLVAPGSAIVSTAAAGAALMAQYPDRLVDGPGALDFFRMSGTSMSAAVVSGAVALLLEAKPTLSPLLVKLALQGSAAFLPNDGLVAGGAGRCRGS
jgi:serine protease AprX